MPERSPPPDSATASLDELIARASTRRLPPVDGWDPPFCGESGIAVAADGRWFHDGAPIARTDMVRLFASLIRRETDGRYLLVTPVEKLGIEVADLPFTADAVRSEGAGTGRRIVFILSTGEPVLADAAHPIFLEPGGKPALTVRGSIAARIPRPVWYELAALAIDEDARPPGLWSAGTFFALAEEP